MTGFTAAFPTHLKALKWGRKEEGRGDERDGEWTDRMHLRKWQRGNGSKDDRRYN